jgi:hypothetical protein
MKIEFIASVGVIAADPATSRRLYVEAIGLPLEGGQDDYQQSEKIGGCKHFGVWPLTQAAQACFGTSEWRPTGLCRGPRSSSRWPIPMP